MLEKRFPKWPRRLRAPSWSLGENQVIQPEKTGEMTMQKEMRPKEMSTPNGGHLYMQTNEIENCIIHYHRAASGALSEVERCATGGAGSGTFKPISGQDSAPNAFEGAGSVILTPDPRRLFAANGGGNSAPQSRVGADGALTPLDVTPPRNPPPGKTRTATTP